MKTCSNFWKKRFPEKGLITQKGTPSRNSIFPIFTLACLYRRKYYCIFGSRENISRIGVNLILDIIS